MAYESVAKRPSYDDIISDFPSHTNMQLPACAQPFPYLQNILYDLSLACAFWVR